MVFPLAVMAHRDHASITDPTILGDTETTEQQAWRGISDAAQDPASADDDHHMHLQINVRVVDEHGRPVTDATHFLKIAIPRIPSADVFKLKHPG